jgi:hypothetical protein
LARLNRQDAKEWIADPVLHALPEASKRDDALAVHRCRVQHMTTAGSGMCDYAAPAYRRIGR